MNNRSPFFPLLLLAVAFVPQVVGAADNLVSPERQADWEKRQAQAVDWQRDASARQSEAEKLYEQTALECQKKFQVNACLSDAHKLYIKSRTEARRLENEGKLLERQIKKEQLNERDQRRAAEAPQHEATLQARESETAAERKAAAEVQAAKEADQAKKAKEGVKRKAADADRLAKKQAQHEAELAARKEKAERRAAEAAAKSAK